MDLEHSIQAFSDIYKSIDVRVVAIKKDDTWNAVHVIIRFRVETVDQIKEIHRKLFSEYGLPDNQEFNIIFEAFDISDWDSIKKKWKQNLLEIGNESVKITSKDILHYGRDEPADHSNLDFVNRHWKSYHGHFTLNLEVARLKLRELDNDVIKLGQSKAIDYLGKILEMSTYQLDSGVYYCCAPVFFKLETLIFDKNSVDALFYGAQTNITGTLSFYETLPFSGMRGKPIKQYDIGDFDFTTIDFSIFRGKKQTIELHPKYQYDFVVARNDIVVLKEVGVVGLYWPEISKTTNPVYSIFEKFVPIETFQNMLLTPEKKKGQGGTLDSSDIFERAVAWMLNLLGISMIHLQEFDQAGTGASRISIDIVGHYENIILLCHPTVATNLQESMDKAINVKASISNEFPNSFQIKSLIITPKSIQNQKNGNTNDDIILVGKEEIEKILEFLKNGNVSEARKIILKIEDRI